MQSFADILGEVFRAMMANKLRTFLTMFGIAWGVGSLLVLVGLGEGFRSGQRRNLASVGNDVIMTFDSTIPPSQSAHRHAALQAHAGR
jgi:putative ABC transport system permease protein